MQALTDDVVIVAAGQLMRQGAVADVLASMSNTSQVTVRTPEPEKLTEALRLAGMTVDADAASALVVTGGTAATVGDTALAAGVAVHGLQANQPDLEDVFLELTHAKAAIR